MQAQQNPNIPVSEIYCSLLHKADKKFSKIRELPYYHRNRHEYDAYFYKVFKVYTQLWKFQQENRQKLVESGLRRSEIGEIASRIAQLYLGQYMRTSEASYLSEAYIFYEAILSREYFKEGMFQDLSLVNKQLRSCSISSESWLMKCKRTFQETHFKEWKLVIQEIVRFLKADTAFMNIRPLRYSIVLDCHPVPLVSFLFTAWYFTLFDIDNGSWSIFRVDFHFPKDLESSSGSPHATGRPNAIIDSTPVAALRQTPAHLLLLRRENNSRSSSTPCGNLLPPLQLHRRPMSRCSRTCPHPYPPHLRSETNARNLFNQMPHKDLVTWTALISGYSQHDRPQDALVLFPEMLRQGLEPNQFTLSRLLKASGAVSDNNHGRQLHTYCFKYGLDSKCLCGHCSCGHESSRRACTQVVLEEAGSGAHRVESSSRRSERDANGKDLDLERDGSRGISDEEDGKTCRKKLRLSKDQSPLSLRHPAQPLFTIRAPHSRCWKVVPTLSPRRLNLHQTPPAAHGAHTRSKLGCALGIDSFHRSAWPPSNFKTIAVKRLAGRKARSTIFSVRLRPCSAPCKFPSPSSKFIQKK
ncbi:hypothetical protein PS1_004802 [Malus domestica]